MKTKVLILCLLFIFSSQNISFLSNEVTQTANVVNEQNALYGDIVKENTNERILYIYSKDSFDKSNITDAILNNSPITRVSMTLDHGNNGTFTQSFSKDVNMSSGKHS